MAEGAVARGRCKGKASIVDLKKVSKDTLRSIRPQTTVDALRKCFPISERGRPPFGMKQWIRLPSSKDVVCSGLDRWGVINILTFSRGRLGQSLLQSPLPNFTTHEERLLHGYESLHDPAPLAYFLQPSVLQQLIKKELISYPQLSVLCSFKEMREFHKYLTDISNGWIIEALKERDQRAVHETKLLKKVGLKIANEKRKEVRKKRVQGLKKMTPDYAYIHQLRHLAVQRKREEGLISRGDKTMEKSLKSQAIRERLARQQLEWRQQLLLGQTMKHVKVDLSKTTGKTEAEEQKQLQALEWLIRKGEASITESEYKKQLQDDLHKDQTNKALERQQAVDKLRATIGKPPKPRGSVLLIIKHAKKYFSLWRQIVEQRRSQRQ